MRFNRFVYLNRPMLSLETHLGVTASPQAPFPANYVTLPVSASHLCFGSPLLTAEEGHVHETKLVDMHSKRAQVTACHPWVDGFS